MKTKTLALLAIVPALALAVGCQAPGERTSGMPEHGDEHHHDAPTPDPSWPMLPDDWLMGEVSGIAVDGNDHIWLVHRPRSLNADEAGLAQGSPAHAVLQPRARRSSSSTPRATSSTVGGTRPATPARATSGPPANTASSWTTWGMSGWPGTAPTTTRFSSSAETGPS